jgi:hypothetical protein
VIAVLISQIHTFTHTPPLDIVTLVTPTFVFLLYKPLIHPFTYAMTLYCNLLINVLC